VKPFFKQASVEEQEYLAAANITALITSWAVYLGTERVRAIVQDVNWVDVDRIAVSVRDTLERSMVAAEKATPAAN
jgi:hypothetical protein